MRISRIYPISWAYLFIELWLAQSPRVRSAWRKPMEKELITEQTKTQSRLDALVEGGAGIAEAVISAFGEQTLGEAVEVASGKFWKPSKPS